jgi:hypothetical protein
VALYARSTRQTAHWLIKEPRNPFFSYHLQQLKRVSMTRG